MNESANAVEEEVQQNIYEYNSTIKDAYELEDEHDVHIKERSGYFSHEFYCLLFPSALHFMCFFAVGFSTPYLSTILASHGISATIIGIYLVVFPISIISVPPITGMIADAFKAQRIMLIASCLLSAITVGFFSFILEIKHLPFKLFVYFLCIVIFAICRASIIPMTDAVVIILLRNDNIEKDYGKSRLWGAIGWSVAALIGSLLEEFLADYMHLLYGTLSLLASGVSWIILALLVLLFGKKIHPPHLIDRIRFDSSDTSTSSSSNNKDMNTNTDTNIQISININTEPFFKRVIKLLTDRTIVWLLIIMMTMGMGTSVVGNYLFLYLTEYFAASDLLLGFCMFMTTVFEIPFFFLGDWIKETAGLRMMMMIAMLSYISRVTIYTYLPVSNPNLVILVEPLHGITYAMMWMVCLGFVTDRASSMGLTSTATGVINMIYSGFGQGMGVFLGGIIYQNFGPYILFRGFACFISLSFLAFVGLLWDSMGANNRSNSLTNIT